MIKAVLIDIDDTLLDFKKCAEQSILKSASEINITLPSNIMEIFTRHNDGWWHRIERGEVTKAQLRQLRFNGIFDEIGVVADGADFDDRFKRNLGDTCVKIDGAKELLDYLSRYKLYVASNAHDENYQRGRLTKAGFIHYFDGLFVSGQMGANKPTKEFFDRAMSVMGDISPSEIVMIGDSLTADVSGAKAYGYHTIWFDKYGVGVGNEADFVVTKLTDIIDIFRSNYE